MNLQMGCNSHSAMLSHRLLHNGNGNGESFYTTMSTSGVIILGLYVMNRRVWSGKRCASIHSIHSFRAMFNFEQISQNKLELLVVVINDNHITVWQHSPYK